VGEPLSDRAVEFRDNQDKQEDCRRHGAATWTALLTSDEGYRQRRRRPIVSDYL